MERVNSITKKIGEIYFSLLSPNELRKMSATKVITADTYDDDGFPIAMGLMDPRMGVIEPGLRCKTCGQRVGKDKCPGHFGHIDLAMPVIHVGHIKIIRDSLRSTCRDCGHLLLTKNERENFIEEIKNYDREGRQKTYLFKQIVKDARKASKCPHCGREVGKIELDKPTTLRENGKKLTPSEVREWLEKIRDEDLPLLDINVKASRPEWTVLTVLPVPPVTVRPSVTLQSGERSEDDLTHKLVDVIRINQRLQENRDAGAPQLIVEDLWELLQYHITTYLDNQTSGIPPARHRSGRPLKTLAQRLKGKEGRFRSNLSGKRVNFSARTVISPDPNLSINEIGIPIKVAEELTIPVRVTTHNIDWCKEMITQKYDPSITAEYVPGVNYVIKNIGGIKRRIKISDRNAEMVADKLEVGSIIERQMMDGDLALFNRQPSLHRMSMMAHRVRVVPGKTFRFNLCVCPPYNADFDGDEMNLHVIQGEEAKAEAEILMKVQENILSPRFGGAIIGGIHDIISGVFLLTNKERKVPIEVASYLLGSVQYHGDIDVQKEDGKKYVMGRDIFSTILPKDLTIRFKSKTYENIDSDEAYVVIKNGRLLQGTIDENSIGAFKGRILDRVIRDHGMDAGRAFIDNATRLGIAVATMFGFTTSIEDEDIPDEAQHKIAEGLDDAMKQIRKLVKAFEQGELESLPGRSIEETLEMEIMRVTGKARDMAGEIAGEHLGLENSAVIMAKSGARGSMLNLSQMSGLVGQQAVRGERISRGYQYRTLPHFKKGDLGASAKGFVGSSYKKGLTPTEYFFHSMGGREGLVDTAVRTSRSGYMQRRLINALEDVKVEKDGTVRQAGGQIIQFIYGEDGIDPTRSLNGKSVDVDRIIEEVLEEA
ncbi:MAG: DNA-directed RNA polymerase subunit A' [Candidatus Thermoplasmatota archaeon]|nr:DNA-directed RNA polymerase subunit A' [Candidatus Thermoplasmatota archaeon]MBS3801164.1 DNA-directed RNA polymerase subunit A' [Candidatus Thermoplasmatota archaeon]